MTLDDPDLFVRHYSDCSVKEGSNLFKTPSHHNENLLDSKHSQLLDSRLSSTSKLNDNKENNKKEGGGTIISNDNVLNTLSETNPGNISAPGQLATLDFSDTCLQRTQKVLGSRLVLGLALLHLNDGTDVSPAIKRCVIIAFNYKNRVD